MGRGQGMPPRPQVEPTDDWHQIALLARAPGQRTYELIRPVVLFGQSPAERAAETGAAQRTVYRQVARFDQLGLAVTIDAIGNIIGVRRGRGGGHGAGAVDGGVAVADVGRLAHVQRGLRGELRADPRGPVVAEDGYRVAAPDPERDKA